MKQEEQAVWGRIETENRLRNLIWTVSGDYSLNMPVDTEAFERSKYIALYDAVRQGSFARYFDQSFFTLYLAKKIYLGAEEPILLDLSRICMDAAVWKRARRERSGINEIRRKAFEEIWDQDAGHMSAALPGRIRWSYMRRALDPQYPMVRELKEILDQILSLEQAEDTETVIRITDRIYNQYLDREFEKKVGGLKEVLSVTMEELKEGGFLEYLRENALEESFDAYMKRLAQSLSRSGTQEEEAKKKEEEKQSGPHVVKIRQEDLDKVYSYVELNFGRSYLSRLEKERLDKRLCRGAHADCSLYLTEGILKNPVLNNYQYQYALRQKEQNINHYSHHRNLAKKNISHLTNLLRQALIRRSETEAVRSDHGHVIPNLLWNVGRTQQRYLFSRQIRHSQSDFVVEVLIDASGSQRTRQETVALQGYIISRALSGAGIRHRVSSFCSFWDYTILHRFRDYEDDRGADWNIMEYTTSSNNRDGLAIRAAADSLWQRPEENKILIVLSDGRPNDVIVNRPGSRNPAAYGGAYAVNDTAREVRRVRNLGISVLGVFAGQEEDLEAEKKIFGRDFAYIREISNFAGVVGRYLKRQLDTEIGN